MISFDRLAEAITISAISKPSLPNFQCIIEPVRVVAATTLRYIAVSIDATAIEGEHTVQTGVVSRFLILVISMVSWES